MRPRIVAALAFLAAFIALALLHLPLLNLPYFWDEAGYYVPAAWDFYRFGRLIPHITLPVGHPPLVPVYLGVAWRCFGYAPVVTRLAMTLIAAATLAATYQLGRRVASREAAAWGAALLALSPLFFAQTTLVHLDLAAALFTTLAVWALLEERIALFVLAASLAVLSKETSVILLPIAWLYRLSPAQQPRGPTSRRRISIKSGVALALPLAPLALWTLYYHHTTGFWTGNREYLSYNLYSTLSPARIFWSLLRRTYELLFSGFNWVITAGALAGYWWGRKPAAPGRADRADRPCWRPFTFLAAGLGIIYLLLLSVVGGAVLPRYLLPVMPCFYLIGAALILRLPPLAARLSLTVAAACLVAAWFINPPYPFPYEDNLAYADFIRLHQQAAHYLEALPDQPRILTAWPASDEIEKPFLGYVARPLRAVEAGGFDLDALAAIPGDSFDILYLYSRKWEPPGNWVTRFPAWLRLQGRYFDYRPQAAADDLAARYHLRVLTRFERRGQWVRIYTRQPASSQTDNSRVKKER